MQAPFIAMVVAITAITPLQAEDKRELGSHQHGHVKMEIAIEKGVMNIALEAPGESIVGFEYAPKTDGEKATVNAASKQLSDAEAVFAFPAAAGCSAKSTEVGLHQHGNHSEFEVSYTFNCSDVAALDSMETKLFSLFPSIEEIDVDYITPGGQGSTELESNATKITFAPAG